MTRKNERILILQSNFESESSYQNIHARQVKAHSMLIIQLKIKK